MDIAALSVNEVPLIADTVVPFVTPGPFTVLPTLIFEFADANVTAVLLLTAPLTTAVVPPNVNTGSSTVTVVEFIVVVVPLTVKFPATVTVELAAAAPALISITVSSAAFTDVPLLPAHATLNFIEPPAPVPVPLPPVNTVFKPAVFVSLVVLDAEPNVKLPVESIVKTSSVPRLFPLDILKLVAL